MFPLYHYYRVGGPPKVHLAIGFRVEGLGFKVLGLGSWVEGFGFGVWCMLQTRTVISNTLKLEP